MRIPTLTCILFLAVYVDIKAQEVNTRVSSPYPIHIKSSALLYEDIFGNISDSLKAGSEIKIFGAKNGFIHIRSGEKAGWIHMSNVPGFYLLAHDFLPGQNQGLIYFDNKCETGTPGKKTAYYLGGENNTPKSLFTFNSDTYGDTEDSTAHYWILYTGIPEQPFMVLFGGHAGDMHHEIPVLLLFGGEITTIWYPNSGNRITSAFFENENNTLLIREAYYCMLAVNTKIKINKGEVTRVKGYFEKNEFERDRLGETGIATDVVLYENSKVILSLKKNTVVEKLELMEADFTSDMVKIRINGSQQGWLHKKKLLEAFPAMYNIACCGCG